MVTRLRICKMRSIGPVKHLPRSEEPAYIRPYATSEFHRVHPFGVMRKNVLLHRDLIRREYYSSPGEHTTQDVI